MAAAKPEVLIYLVPDKIATKFQMLQSSFRIQNVISIIADTAHVIGCPKSKTAADKPEKDNISGIFQDIVLKFQHPVTLVSIRSTAIELLVLETINLVVGISFLSCLETEI